MDEANDLEEKKLIGSGGHAFVKLTREEQMRASVGVPEIFLGNVGRLNEDRFTRYYCNKCTKEYSGSPRINYESPIETMGEGIILIENGEYTCKTCTNILVLYRKFNK